MFIYLSLYRQYRSQNFDEIVGQDHIVQTLKNALANDRIAHAYLFSGPRGTGKTSIARILAHELECDPLDIIEIDAASHRGIDEVRALREQVEFQPVASKRKVYILDEVHMLTKEAFNALLKTLEEPPAFVHFVLCTTEPHKVPATIISRAQRFDFHPGTKETIETLLRRVIAAEGKEMPDEIIGLIAQHAQGGYRDALASLEQVFSIEDGENLMQKVHHVLGIADAADVQEFSEALLQQNSERAFMCLARISSSGVDITSFVKGVLGYIRSTLLLNIQEDGLGVGNVRSIATLVMLLHSCLRQVKISPVPILPLELVVLEWCGQNDSPVKESGSEPMTEPTMSGEPQFERTEEVKTVQPSEGGLAEWWPQVLQEIKPHNHTLEALLKGCSPTEVIDDTLTLHFKYKFHKERIEEPENKAIVVDVIQRVSGRKLKVTCVLQERGGDSTVVFHGAGATSETIVPTKPVRAERTPSSKMRRRPDTIDTARNEMLEKAMKDLGGKIIE